MTRSEVNGLRSRGQWAVRIKPVSLICATNRCKGESMSHHYSGLDWGFPRGDARLDLTDLYAFPKPGDPDKSIVIMNVHPSVRDYLDREGPLAPTITDPFA